MSEKNGMYAKIIFGIIFGLTAMWTVHAEEEFPLSYSCLNCHQDRYEEWSRSMHALAVSDPVFEAAYLKATQSDSQYRSFCLTCHSPTIRKTNDFDLQKSISIEGVTCSFCHTVTGIENNTYIFNSSNPMHGPYNDSVTDAHASEYSPLLTRSEFCAGCHEFSIKGVPISETYSEWKEGPYSAEGKQCQDCHMEAKSGQAAKNGTFREKVYQHFWYGGHSGQFLEKAFKIDTIIRQTGNHAIATLNITNSNVGHKIPSGLPSRKVVLNFRVRDEKGIEILNETKVYAKTLVDRYGNEVFDFWKGASIAKDNRIRPRESRIEEFEFDVPEGTGKLETEATLTYQVDAEIITRTVESMKVEIASSRTEWVSSAPLAVPTPEEAPAPTAAAIIAVIAVALYTYRRKWRQ